MRKVLAQVVSLAFMLVLGFGTAQATELVFQFTNPSFGGNPLMGSFLMNKANAQNDKKAPSRPVVERNPLDDFSENLERQVLNRLSRDIVDRVFGDEGIEEGSFQVGGFLIDVIEDLDQVTLNIIDVNTGNETSITLPFF